MSVAFYTKACVFVAVFQICQAAQSVTFSQESSVSDESKLVFQHRTFKKPLVRRQSQEERPLPSDDDHKSFEVQHSAKLVRHKMQHKKQKHHGRHAEKEGHQHQHSHRGEEGYATGSDVDTDSESKEGHDTEWSYSAPDDWAGLTGNADCGHAAQSPIQFNDSSSTNVGSDRLIDRVNYGAMTGRKLKNNGHNVQVDGEFGNFTLPDGDYAFKQFHFHFPSDHKINNRNAAGEMHMVHKRTDDATKIAVISMFFESDPQYLGDYPDSSQRKAELDFMSNLGFGGTLPAKDADVDVALGVDLVSAFRAQLEGTYFHYVGSFTTPPCTEGVHWYVMRRPAAVSTDMVASFKTLFPNPMNNRPVQAVNGRTVVVGAISEPTTSS